MGPTGRWLARAARAWRQAVADRLRDQRFLLGWHAGWTVRNPVAYECRPESSLTARPAKRRATGSLVRQFGHFTLVYLLRESAAAWMEENLRGRFKATWSPEYAVPMLTFSRQEDAARFRLAFPDREASERAGLVWIGPETSPLAIFTVLR